MVTMASGMAVIWTREFPETLCGLAAVVLSVLVLPLRTVNGEGRRG